MNGFELEPKDISVEGNKSTETLINYPEPSPSHLAWLEQQQKN